MQSDGYDCCSDVARNCCGKVRYENVPVRSDGCDSIVDLASVICHPFACHAFMFVLACRGRLRLASNEQYERHFLKRSLSVAVS